MVLKGDAHIARFMTLCMLKPWSLTADLKAPPRSRRRSRPRPPYQSAHARTTKLLYRGDAAPTVRFGCAWPPPVGTITDPHVAVVSLSGGRTTSGCAYINEGYDALSRSRPGHGLRACSRSLGMRGEKSRMMGGAPTRNHRMRGASSTPAGSLASGLQCNDEYLLSADEVRRPGCVGGCRWPLASRASCHAAAGIFLNDSQSDGIATTVG